MNQWRPPRVGSGAACCLLAAIPEVRIGIDCRLERCGERLAGRLVLVVAVLHTDGPTAYALRMPVLELVETTREERSSATSGRI